MTDKRSGRDQATGCIHAAQNNILAATAPQSTWRPSHIELAQSHALVAIAIQLDRIATRMEDQR